ncbi:MAG: glutamine-hydrolyzing GMP synthase [Pseudomonadota bacterium]
MMKPSAGIVVLDFGSQYTQLIARRIRELNVYSEIQSFNVGVERVREMRPAGVILSGGPFSCYDEDSPQIGEDVFQLGVPVLGICYGLQLMAKIFGGQVAAGEKREYGRVTIELTSDDCPLWRGLALDEELLVWMSHGDRIDGLPEGFDVIARSNNAPVAAAWHKEKRFFGVQFHPEVVHTSCGTEILSNFVFEVCGCTPDWTMASFVDSQLTNIRDLVGSKKVICGLSGGVDSSVAAVLVHRAIGDQLNCVFVDNGLLREGERKQVEEVFLQQFKMPLLVVDARKRFLDRLGGVSDPEQKRKAIGNEFIAVFEEQAERLPEPAEFLVQGTLYPDVIESASFKGPSVTIKSHHNVGGLPDRMSLGLVEPLRELFKDEVRLLGEELSIPRNVLWRQPFPGPGLAVRILGEVTEERLALLRRADVILEQEIREAGLYEKIWQSFGVLLPIKTVGVMGDSRTYESVLAIRAVHSKDGMTADWAPLSHDLLAKMSNRIINEVEGVNRVVYDISSKPPATIEWE